MMDMNQALLFDVSNGIATITINRPEARNALNAEVREGIRASVKSFAQNDDAKVLIITATGDVAFSSGADLKEMNDSAMTIPPDDFIPNFPTHKPVIAAVNGAALAGGFLLAQQADLVIAVEHATFAITEVRHGRGAPWAAPLPLMIPPRLAMELLLTGLPITAARAHEIGLINYIVAPKDLMSTSVALALALVDNAPLSVAASKAMVRNSLSNALGESRTQANQIWSSVYLSDDAQEGPRAFKEKRAPRWSGH